MTKVYDSATDIITFARSSSGTALRRVGYGDELVTNGDFATTDISAWDSFDGTLAVVGGQLELTYTNVTQYVWVEVTTTPGTLYEFSIDCRSDNAVGHKLLAYSDGFPSGTEIAANPSFVNFSASLTTQTLKVRATTSTTLFMVSTQLTSGTAYFDNVSVKEVIFDRATDDLVLFDHPDDIPRIEYGSDGTLKGLLIEEQRTNLVTYSEDFSNAAWDKVGAVTVDSTLVTGPDGTLSGRRVLNCADVAGDRLVDLVSITNATLTGSIWVKGEGDNIGKDIQLTVKRTGGTFVGTTVSHTLTADWERIHATFTQDPTNTAARLVLVNPANGNEASEVLIYGAQLEEGSFPTSYIPTSGSQQTRSADVASIPVSAFGYNQEAGTIVVEVDSVDDGANTGIVSLDDGTTNNMMSIQHSQTPKSYFVIKSGNVAQASPELSTWLAGERTLALSYKENDFAFTEDGAAVTPVNSATVPSITTLNIGKFTSNVNSFGAGLCHIKSLKYYPRRLTDAQLQELTS